MDFLILILTLWLCWGLYQVLVYVASRSRNLPPGPRPLPVIGNLLELGSHPHISLAKLARVHGPIMSLKLGCMTTIVVSSAPIAREILQTHDSVLSNRTIPDSLSTCCFDELGITFMPISPLWRNYRRISNLHLFSRKALDFSQHLRNCKIQELLVLVGKYCNTRTAMDIGEAVFTTAVNPLGNMIFSMDLGGATSESTKDLKELVWNIEVEVGKTNLADYFPVLRWADPQGAKSRMEAYFKRMFDLFDRIISKRLETRTVPSSDRKNDLLDALLDLAKDKEEDMNMPAMKNINLMRCWLGRQMQVHEVVIPSYCMYVSLC
ncbi:hypothetical protein SAY87_031927 [Trapa incisa]|uniref:Cytochrome P450 n=1 Tax=Trapa incisa TaxID=236973 RepID=A0AAN7QQ68_9MYRT|nr:hypothetical protein SAY87_031927 [Trapa incisa]